MAVSVCPLIFIAKMRLSGYAEIVMGASWGSKGGLRQLLGDLRILEWKMLVATLKAIIDCR